MTTDPSHSLTRFITIPGMVILSLLLHAAVINGLIHMSGHATPLPASSPQIISIDMIAPQAMTPARPQVQPPVIEPEPEPEPPPPKEVPVVIEKPKPHPKPKPKVKPQRQAKPVPDAVAPATEPVDVPVGAMAAPPQNVESAVSSGPVAPQGISIGKPNYPTRALDLRIEGEVKVKFDINTDGHPVNIEILEARPANMFERSVRQAMRKWRYVPGKAYYGCTKRIIFRIDGKSSVE